MLGFPCGSDKESACNAGDPCSIPGLGRSPGEGYGNPLQYSCLEDPMDGGAWQATYHGVTKSRTWQSNFTFTFSLMLKLKLQYFGYQMWRTDSFEKTLMLGRFSGRRRKGGQRMRWLDGIINSMNIIKLNEFEQTPGVGDRQGSLECYSSWGHKELNMTDRLNWTEEYTVALFWQVNGSSYNLW